MDSIIYPEQILATFAETVASSALFEFSKYVYSRKGQTDSRDIIAIAAKNLQECNIQKMRNELYSNQELAFHSKVIIENTIYHLPMIDFITKDRSQLPITHLEDFASLHSCQLFICESGSSFHGYFTTLLDVNSWYSFLGELLLLNITPGKDTVDTRWVGHSLIQGFSSLRLSNNTKKLLPKIIYVSD
jgi:hypothetical protein